MKLVWLFLDPTALQDEVFLIYRCSDVLQLHLKHSGDLMQLSSLGLN